MKIIALPWPKTDLSPNARVHHFKRARAFKAYKTGCAWEAKAQGLRRVEAAKIQVRVTFHPPDNRRRDLDNMIGAFKAGADGIRDVLGIDDSRWIVSYERGVPTDCGRVYVAFPELPDSKTDFELWAESIL